MRRGFTLMELIIVIIILGILATIGFSQYQKLVEKGRTAEAKTILGQLRTAEETYYLEHNLYSAVMTELDIGAPEACTPTHFFNYLVSSPSGDGSDFLVTATRCLAAEGGKEPGGSAAYIVTIDNTGSWGGTAGYY